MPIWGGGGAVRHLFVLAHLASQVLAKRLSPSNIHLSCYKLAQNEENITQSLLLQESAVFLEQCKSDKL